MNPSSQKRNPRKTYVADLIFCFYCALLIVYTACHQRDRFVRAHASPGRKTACNLSLRARKQGRYCVVNQLGFRSVEF